MIPKTKHILNGDALHYQIKDIVTGDFIIMRECLIEGPIEYNDYSSFCTRRKLFFHEEYGVPDHEYVSKSYEQLSRVKNLAKVGIVHLWFEYDLFCQTNLWFICHLLKEINYQGELYLVSPNHEKWTGFGSMKKSDFLTAYDQKKRLEKEYLTLLSETWLAYSTSNTSLLASYKKELLVLNPMIEEVIKAEVERKVVGDESRPIKTVTQILGDNKEFREVFRKFCEIEGVYGFGDLQVKKIYDEIMKKQQL